MEASNKSMIKREIKHTGATFTPPELADFLAEKLCSLMDKSSYQLNILDPSCGEGELLMAIGKQLLALGIEFKLTGFDSNNEYIETTRRRLNELGNISYEVIAGDFLEVNNIYRDLFNNEVKSTEHNKYDLIIANPPYVRTQILGAKKAKELAKKYNLKGRVDLYYPFLVEMTKCLKKDGYIGVITSNKFIFNKSGESVRHFMATNYDILELLDLGDTKLFNAAVLPSIFIGKKDISRLDSEAKFVKIYEAINGGIESLNYTDSIYDALKNETSGYYKTNGKVFKKTNGHININPTSISTWSLLNDEEDDLISKIKTVSKYTIGDLFKVKVGIKTTADKVFISDKWYELGDNQPEDELLKPLISQENIEAWGASHNKNLKILYPYISKNGKKSVIELEQFPKTAKYLALHQEKLKSREYVIKSGRKWYEIWVPHNPEHWSYPKLVFPDISPKPRFFYDEGGMLVNGNCYWISGQTEGDINKLLFIQGIANSQLMSKYHDLVFNNKLYSGRRRYITQYVEKYPLPDFNTDCAKQIVSLVKQLNAETNVESIKSLEHSLEIVVKAAFSIS